MQSNIEEEFDKGTKIASVTATINSNTTISSTGTNVKLNLNSIVSNNSEFELSGDGGIICPYTGTVLVTVSAMVSPRKGYVGLTVFKNTTSAVDYYEPSGTQEYGCISFANRPISVSAGDKLYLYARSSVANDTIESSSRTNLNVMYIDFSEESE